MSRYKVTASFAMFRHDEEVSSVDMMVICADLDAATRVFLSRVEELNDKAASAYNYDELQAKAYIEAMSGKYSISTVNNFQLNLKSKNTVLHDEDE